MGKKEKKPKKEKEITIRYPAPSFLDKLLRWGVNKVIDRYFNGVWIRKEEGTNKLTVEWY